MKTSEIFEIYSQHVCKPKASFFEQLNLKMVQGKRYGIYIEMLEGLREDDPPLKLIDCHTSGGVKNLGSHHPEIDKALTDGLKAGLDIGDHHLISEQRALLGKELATLLPGDISKTMFSVGGGEAIDLSIKLARGYTKRSQIISADKAYHGVTGFALGACSKSFREPFHWNLTDFKHVPFGNIDILHKSITEETAAVIFETIPATGGILIPEKGYFSEIREICNETGTIMIIDEVQTGLGRTGQLWGIHGGVYPDEKIVPDIIVLAKGMSAGVYPLSTTSYKPFLEEVFDEDPFLHISTTGGSELGCFVTRKMLEIISEPSFLKHVQEMGNLFQKGLLEIKEKSEKIIDVRGRGLMWGIEFEDELFSLFFTLSMIKNGVFCDYCGNFKQVNKFLPPLIIQPEEIQIILNKIEEGLSNLG